MKKFCTLILSVLAFPGLAVADFKSDLVGLGVPSEVAKRVTEGVQFSAEESSITTDTTDGADNKSLEICGGGAWSNNGSRGGCIEVVGNEGQGDYGSTGDVSLLSGNKATSGITLDTSYGSGVVSVYGDIEFSSLYGVVNDIETAAAAGSNQADATELDGRVTLVSAADGTKGVKFMADPVVGGSYRVYNTANAILKVYPGSGDAINANAANAVVSVAAYSALICEASSASQLWCTEGANP